MSEAIANIPAAEQPTRDDLIGYLPVTTPEEDLAWTSLFPELCCWYADREYKRKKKDRENTDRPAQGIQKYNFVR